LDKLKNRAPKYGRKLLKSLLLTYKRNSNALLISSKELQKGSNNYKRSNFCVNNYCEELLIAT